LKMASVLPQDSLYQESPSNPACARHRHPLGKFLLRLPSTASSVPAGKGRAVANRWMLLQRIDDARLKADGRLTRRQVAQGMVDFWSDDVEAVARALVGLPSSPCRVVAGLAELAREMVEKRQL
jgi:hypothetical protein